MKNILEFKVNKSKGVDVIIVSKATNIYNSEPENRLTVKPEISNDMNFLSQRYI